MVLYFEYTDFENKTAKIDVEALVRIFLVRILPTIRYMVQIIELWVQHTR